MAHRRYQKSLEKVEVVRTTVASDLGTTGVTQTDATTIAVDDGSRSSPQQRSHVSPLPRSPRRFQSPVPIRPQENDVVLDLDTNLVSNEAAMVNEAKGFLVVTPQPTTVTTTESTGEAKGEDDVRVPVTVTPSLLTSTMVTDSEEHDGSLVVGFAPFQPNSRGNALGSDARRINVMPRAVLPPVPKESVRQLPPVDSELKQRMPSAPLGKAHIELKSGSRDNDGQSNDVDEQKSDEQLSLDPVAEVVRTASSPNTPPMISQQQQRSGTPRQHVSPSRHPIPLIPDDEGNGNRRDTDSPLPGMMPQASQLSDSKGDGDGPAVV